MPQQFDEAKRLQALRRLDLIDTPPEPEYDELVQLAAAICEVPISLLSLIDEKREWYKANIGMNIPELPQELTFCRYTILQDDLLLVEDTLRDSRFAKHPAVTSRPSVRFYAGISIKTSDGYPVGTLCIADFAPRRLAETQFKTLKVLARHANALLELREQRLSMQRTLSQLEQANSSLRELATTDALTDLPNRRAFEERLTNEFLAARRSRRPLSVMLLDIDNFKQHNDRSGHDTGDDILRQFAKILRQAARGHDLVARYGGEEFAIVLADTDEVQANILGERILDVIRSATWPNEPVTTSAGVACLTPATPSRNHLVTLADEALYIAKRSGKNRIIMYNTYFQQVASTITAQSANTSALLFVTKK